MAILGWRKLLGTGLICGGLLMFEIFSTRLLSVILDGQFIIFTIALAMLGTGTATSMSSISRLKTNQKLDSDSLGLTGLFLGLSYIVCLFFISQVCTYSNNIVNSVIESGGLIALVEHIRSNIINQLILSGAMLFVPYFIFGDFIAKLFNSVNHSGYSKLYSADLIGASLGCVLAIATLSYTGFSGCLSIILISTFAGAVLLINKSLKLVFGICIILITLTGFAMTNNTLVSSLEPRPPLNKLSRNFNNRFDVSEDWHVWNAHSRIALLDMKNRETGKSIKQVYAHEDGTGWALVPNFSDEVRPIFDLVTMFNPKKVLVLFAGVGSDILEIDRNCSGNCTITGVEINRHMVEHALKQENSALRKLVSKPNIKLEVAEAREFLERDTGKYDTILLSWWGAGASHYVGTSSKLAGYLYTKEAYAALIDHLTPKGTIVILNGSKAQSLVTFREVFQDKDVGKLAGRVVIIRKNKNNESVPAHLSFYDTLEQMRLIIKPSGFDYREEAVLQAVAKSLDSIVVISSKEANPDYPVYEEIFNGMDLESINARLILRKGVELSVVTDDRPFINELVPRSYYFSLEKLFNLPKKNEGPWGLTRIFIWFIFFLSSVTVVLIIGPLLNRHGPRASRNNFIALLYFLSLGAGFMFLEVGLLRKLGLLLGHPSFALSIVLASLIFSTGLGSLCSDQLFNSGLLTAKRAVIAIIIFTMLGSIFYEWFYQTIIIKPLIVKSFLVVAGLFPLGFVMGQLFPQGLAAFGKTDSRIVPWAWAINSTASTIFVGIGYILSYPLGFSTLLYLGCLCYAVILVLPLPRTGQQYA